MNKNNILASNIVFKEELREVQELVLKTVSDSVMKTAGVYGSNTMIMSGTKFPTYSKDGKKVLDNIKFYGEIENAIVDELHQIVNHVVSEVGDGTTSTVRLSYLIFRALLMKEYGKDDTPYNIITGFNKAADEIINKINELGRDCTIDDIYNICMISTNGNEKVSRQISDIYNKYGLDVFINVETSTTEESMIKEYDGIDLARGYANTAYVNTKDGKCRLRNAKVYIFSDPIDTEEMIGLFTRIVYENIMMPYMEMSKGNKSVQMIPTAILAPSISRDASNLLEDLELMLYEYNNKNMIEAKPPIVIISQLNRYADDVNDIAKLCGCKTIHKYIDPTVQKKDIEAGKAPTVDTVTLFCGQVDMLEVGNNDSKFINPYNMYERGEDGNIIIGEDGNPIYSAVYNSMVNFLESQIAECEAEPSPDIVTLKMLRRRLSNLKANMVDYYIGGISVSDRDSIKDLVEDAVLNCRSAAHNGVGYGANFMTIRAANTIIADRNDNHGYVSIIYDAYIQFLKEIYASAINDRDRVETEVSKSLELGMPLNLRTMEYDGYVLSSIKSDAAILEGIAKVITIMFTANQALISDTVNNRYKPSTEN